MSIERRDKRVTDRSNKFFTQMAKGKHPNHKPDLYVVELQAGNDKKQRSSKVDFDAIEKEESAEREAMEKDML